jgi:hypothetical protein
MECNNEIYLTLSISFSIDNYKTTLRIPFDTMFIYFNFFQTSYISIKPIIIRCLFTQKLKIQSNNVMFLWELKMIKKYELQSTCKLYFIRFVRFRKSLHFCLEF